MVQHPVRSLGHCDAVPQVRRRQCARKSAWAYIADPFGPPRLVVTLHLSNDSFRISCMGGYRSPCSANEKQIPSPTMK